MARLYQKYSSRRPRQEERCLLKSVMPEYRYVPDITCIMNAVNTQIGFKYTRNQIIELNTERPSLSFDPRTFFVNASIRQCDIAF